MKIVCFIHCNKGTIPKSSKSKREITVRCFTSTKVTITSQIIISKVLNEPRFYSRPFLQNYGLNSQITYYYTFFAMYEMHFSDEIGKRAKFSRFFFKNNLIM